MSSRPRHVAVVGAGITGLVTARHLADAGARVTVLESRPTVGGQVRSLPFGDHVVDVGAESLHTATPAVLELLAELHLDAEVVDAAPGHTWLATSRGLRRLPAGVGPTGPTKLWPVVTAGILSPAGLLRAAAEPFARRGHDGHDLSVGDYLTRRFGPQLTARLVDPLLGNLHAGDVHRLSLQAAAPQLDRTARQHRSVVLGRRRGAGRGHPPRFVSVPGGLGRIPAALAADPRIEVRTSAAVRQLAAAGAGHELTLVSGTRLRADAVVLAVPADVAAALLAPLDAGAARSLGEVRTASVATVLVSYPRAALAEVDGNGLLVPSSAGHLLKAATWLGNKWPHLADDDRSLVRLSAGRADDDRLGVLDDDELVRILHGELAELTGLAAAPLGALVQRWPSTMPQLEVGHTERIAAVRRQLDGARHHVTLAGAAYDGVGITACLRSAEGAARSVMADLDQLQEVAR